LVKALQLHRMHTPGPLVFPGPYGNKTIDYNNWRTRVWLPLLARTGPDEENPNRVAIEGTFHMLRHFFVTALISKGVNIKVVQTLAGHHSAAFTLDQYADVIPQDIEDAGEKVAAVLFAASGSILVAPRKTMLPAKSQVIDLTSAPGRIRTADHLVRSQVLYPAELRAQPQGSLPGSPLRRTHGRESLSMQPAA
jgi:hypothetical protein